MMVRDHILHIRDSGGIYGGERVILTLGKNIALRGLVDFSLLCMRRPDGRSEPLISSAKKIGLHVEAIDVKHRFDLRAIMKMREYIKAHNISLIHTHDFKSDCYGIWATHNLDVKRVATAHGSTRDSLVKKLYLFFDEYLAYRFYDKIIAVSEDLQSQLRGKHIQPDKIEVIQNGLDSDLLSLNEGIPEPPLPFVKRPGMRVFAVIGRLYPDKGHSLFLRALANTTAKYPEARGLIIGDGPEKESILRQIRTLHLEDRVYYCGVRKDIKNIYNMIDYLVIPSFTEGLPYVLLEAMAGSIPVLATAVGDIPLLIQDEVTGYLVPPGDVEAVSRRMEDLISKQDSARVMADNGKKLLKERYSAQGMVEKTERLYLSLLS